LLINSGPSTISCSFQSLYLTPGTVSWLLNATIIPTSVIPVSVTLTSVTPFILTTFS
jgi:hypothetical protein